MLRQALRRVPRTLVMPQTRSMTSALAPSTQRLVDALQTVKLSNGLTMRYCDTAPGENDKPLVVFLRGAASRARRPTKRDGGRRAAAAEPESPGGDRWRVVRGGGVAAPPRPRRGYSSLRAASTDPRRRKFRKFRVRAGTAGPSAGSRGGTSSRRRTRAATAPSRRTFGVSAAPTRRKARSTTASRSASATSRRF